PVSHTKGYVGHTLGACGAIETIFILAMMEGGFLAPTLNLENIDPACEGLGHLQDVVETQIELALNNNFAFGGINTSILLRRAQES
ncbi:3-oxoacyl-ACP synthase, partial [Myxococcota bacterium]|nr:3-oxoacyl-ACP synthase [Myxococcota bacterium]